MTRDWDHPRPRSRPSPTKPASAERDAAPRDPDRDDEAFTASAALIFLAASVLVLTAIIAAACFAVDRWGGGVSAPVTIGGKWTLRAGDRP